MPKRQYFEGENGQLGFVLGDQATGPVVTVMIYDVKNYYQTLIYFLNRTGEIAKLRGIKTGLTARDERDPKQPVPEEVIEAEKRLEAVFWNKFDGAYARLDGRIATITEEAQDFLKSVEFWAKKCNCGFPHEHGRQLFYGLVGSVDRRRYYRRTIRADLARIKNGQSPVVHSVYAIEENYQKLLEKRRQGKVNKKPPV